MQLHIIQTGLSLVLFLGGFFMIGIGASMKSEKHSNLIALVGFVLVIVNLIFLGSVTLSQTLAKSVV